MPAAPSIVCAYLTVCAGVDLLVGNSRHGLPCDVSRTVATAYLTRCIPTGCVRSCTGLRPSLALHRDASPDAPNRGHRHPRHRHRPYDRQACARDVAIVLLGFASAVRRSELEALTVGDLEHRFGGVIATAPRAKSKQRHRGLLLVPSGRAGVGPDSVQASGGTLHSGRSIRARVSLHFGFRPPDAATWRGSGVDASKQPAAIEVVDQRQGLLGSGRFATDKVDFDAMRDYLSRWSNSGWGRRGQPRRWPPALVTEPRGRRAGRRRPGEVLPNPRPARTTR